MLLLTRYPGESIRIGDNITLSVLGIAEGRVKIGISAPKHVDVDRAEGRQRKIREPRRAPAG